MSKILKSYFAILCAVVLFAGVIGVRADAAFVEDYDISGTEDTDVVVLDCTEIPLYVKNEYIGSGIKIEETTYVPLLAFTETMLEKECDATWDQETSSTTLTTDELTINLTVGDGYMVANGRHLYLENGAYNINGTILVPIRELAKVFNLDVHWDDNRWTIRINNSDIEILQSGDEFYNADDLYWLSRVIYSEAGNQLLEGKIAVGNVVINRLNDDTGVFPDTIKDIIFQPGQFSVVDTGAINLDPNPESVVAAKLSLEGYNTADDSKFFLNPEISSSKWFRTYRTFVSSIGDHDFYA